MAIYRFRSLRTRLAFLLLTPVALILFFSGFFGFIYARDIMLAQWEEAATLKLQRAAGIVEMRLLRPIEWMERFHDSGHMMERRFLQNLILQQLRELDGVVGVDLIWSNAAGSPGKQKGPHHSGRGAGMPFHRGRIIGLTKPTFKASEGVETVTIGSSLEDEQGGELGKLQVEMRFDYLMKDIFQWGWWDSEVAYLVDLDGNYVLDTESKADAPTRLEGRSNPFHQEILRQIKQEQFGTLFGQGHPPKNVAGFHRIDYAKWVIVLIAQGDRVLAPIIRYRNYHFIGSFILLVVVIVLIRSNLTRLVGSIRKISSQANQVAKGEYGAPIPSKARDEIGQLTHSFNQMVEGLKERDLIRNTFGRYVDPDFAQRIMARPEARQLGGQRREVIIMMSDIRGFTAMAETLTPESTVTILNRYFARMIHIINQFDGIIVDFIGDAILVFFDPLDGSIQDVATKGIQCAFQMKQDMALVNQALREESLPEFEMGIGLNAGPVVIGNIGSEERAKYGIVGSAVNVTQRIQGQAQGGEVVVADVVYRYVKDLVTIHRTFQAQLKGIQSPVTLHVVNPKHELPAG